MTFAGYATKSIARRASAANSPGFPAARPAARAVLCGRNAVQLSHPGANLSLDELSARLEGVAEILARNEFLLRARIEGYELTIFPDARAIVTGTDEVAVARAVYAKYVGT